MDLNQHTFQEIQRQMKGEPKAVSQMIAVEDQIMSLKMVRRFFANAMLTARHYHEKCARAILDGRYSAKQLESIEAERQSLSVIIGGALGIDFLGNLLRAVVLGSVQAFVEGWEQIVLSPPSS